MKKLFATLTIGLIILVLTFPSINVFAVEGGGRPGVDGGGTPGVDGGGTPETAGGKTFKLENPLGSDSIIKIINNILNYLIYLSIPIVALMVLIGGYQILFARDKAENVKKGIDTIKYAALGFAIVLVSKGVALVILKLLGR